MTSLQKLKSLSSLKEYEVVLNRIECSGNGMLVKLADLEDNLIHVPPTFFRRFRLFNACVRQSDSCYKHIIIMLELSGRPALSLFLSVLRCMLSKTRTTSMHLMTLQIATVILDAN